jgi:Transposase IS4
VQKRKDHTSNWGSENPVLECQANKRVMSGRKINMMMKFLHVCSLSNQPSTMDVHYDPSYKVKELLELLEERYNRLFVAGKNLSLDETLIRAFG